MAFLPFFLCLEFFFFLANKLLFEVVECPTTLNCPTLCWGLTDWTDPIVCSKEQPVISTGCPTTLAPKLESSSLNLRTQLTVTQHLYIVHVTTVLMFVVICLMFHLGFIKLRARLIQNYTPRALPKVRYVPKPLHISAV